MDEFNVTISESTFSLKLDHIPCTWLGIAIHVENHSNNTLVSFPREPDRRLDGPTLYSRHSLAAGADHDTSQPKLVAFVRTIRFLQFLHE
jgi:hypothetical protein